MSSLLPNEIMKRNNITTFMPLLESSYNSLKSGMDSVIYSKKEELCRYVENNILNAIINKQFKDLNDIEYNLYWNLFTYLEWKSEVFK